MNLRELMEKRARLITEARGVVEGAEKENRNLTAEEQARYDKLMADALELKARIDRATQLADEESRNAQAFQGGEMRGYPQQDGEQRSKNPRETDEYRQAFGSFLRGGLANLSVVEHRALQSDLNTSGGYLVTPMQFVNDLIKAVDNMVWVRQWASTFQVPTAQSLGVPTLEADPADPTWTAEIATGTEDSTMAFGRRELHPHPLAKRIKVSNKLLRQVPNTETLVRERLAYKFAVTMEQAYMTGTGAGQPLGVFVASADGVTTARDVATDNAATAPTFNGLINAKYALKGQYWPGARWLMHRDVVKVIAKLVDGNGQYIWRDSVQAGEPDRLLGLPVFLSEYAPSTMTANQYVGILGDFSYYWVADALDMQIQRLAELYAESNQTGLIGRMESDAQPVLAEAFVRVKLGAGG